MHMLTVIMKDDLYLYLAYLEASEDEDRENELKEWDAISLESWD